MRVCEDIAISSPELLFVEMAETMTPAEHLLLGFELCGRFSRHPDNWRNGQGKLGVAPATSVARIADFMNATKWLHGITNARMTLKALADNAWSPAEAVVATMVSLPIEEYGYGLGRCTLNARVMPGNDLARTMTRESRVPDIVFSDTSVGINYDGVVHLDLRAIAKAGVELGLHPEIAATQIELEKVIREVRAKAIDDIRRNRELMACGYTVFPVTKEDLYEEGGLDRVMLQVFDALERTGKMDLSRQREAMDLLFAKRQRQRLTWSLIPGSKETLIPANLGLNYSNQPFEASEMIIGF